MTINAPVDVEDAAVAFVIEIAFVDVAPRSVTVSKVSDSEVK